MKRLLLPILLASLMLFASQKAGVQQLQSSGIISDEAEAQENAPYHMSTFLCPGPTDCCQVPVPQMTQPVPGGTPTVVAESDVILYGAHVSNLNTPIPTPTPTPPPIPAPTATPYVGKLFGPVLRAGDVWKSFGVIVKNVADCGGPATAGVFTTSTACVNGVNHSNLYANVMGYLGFTKFREDATHSDTGAQQVIIQMANLVKGYLGVPVTGTQLSITDDPSNTQAANCPSPPNVYCGNRLDTLRQQQTAANAGILAAIEFPNEIDNNVFSYVSDVDGGTYFCNENGSALGCAKYENELYTQFKADPILGAYEVIGLSHAGGGQSDSCIQDGTVCNHANADNVPVGASFADLINFHNYYQTPTLNNSPADNMTFFSFLTNVDQIGQLLIGDGPLVQPAQGLTTTWLGHFPIAPLFVDNVTQGFTNGTVPQIANGTNIPFRVTTETGINVFSGSVSRDIQGKSQVNVLMDGIIQSWGDPQSGLSTFIYESTEHGPNDSGFGMVNPSTAMNASFNPSLVAATTCTISWP
jgi:hypothetical protein